MKNVLIGAVATVGCLIAFWIGRWTSPETPVQMLQHDTLPPIVRIDTVRDTLLVPKYVQVERFDTIRDTVDGKPVYLPVPISSYLFTDDSTYRIDMEGYHVKARSIEVYPRTVTQTVVERIEVSGKPKRWGIRVSAGGAITSHGIQPYIGIGVQYHLIYF